MNAPVWRRGIAKAYIVFAHWHQIRSAWVGNVAPSVSRIRMNTSGRSKGGRWSPSGQKWGSPPLRCSRKSGVAPARTCTTSWGNTPERAGWGILSSALARNPNARKTTASATSKESSAGNFAIAPTAATWRTRLTGKKGSKENCGNSIWRVNKKTR